MKLHKIIFLGLWMAFTAGSTQAIVSVTTEKITNHLTIVQGAINGASVTRGDKSLVIYGDPQGNFGTVDSVLFTHNHRDAVWAGIPLVEKGAKAIVPASETESFTQSESFWSQFQQSRFHDYQQQSTKLPTRSIAVNRSVREGDAWDWAGIPIQVLDTPGYTRGAVSYLMKIDNQIVAFTGDLIYGDGKLFDLYSLQDAIPEAKIGGYHGYAARLSQVVNSLRKVAEQKPDILIPVRGPIIRDPQAAIARLIERIQAVYRNYLSIDALRWYFGDDHIRTKGSRVLGASLVLESISPADIFEKLPSWIVPISNSRLILAADGSGFMVDCGGRDILEELVKLRDSHKLTSLDHIFITHYHDDHTDQVPALVQTFNAKVYSCPELTDIFENPSAYRLPCLTANPIPVTRKFMNGETWRWKEFTMTGYFFPGQTLLHQALLVKKDGGEAIFFIGDSFTPYGIDDYCLPNRNFLQEDMSYLYCLDLVRKMPPDTLLINQHVGPAFRFSAQQIDRMEKTLKDRMVLLRELLPWEDPNFGLDEGWARFYPYAVSLRKGEPTSLTLRIMNHSSQEHTFSIQLNIPKGWGLESGEPLLAISPRQEGAVPMQITPPEDAPAGTYLITADIQWNHWDLHEWTEAIIVIEP